MSSATIAGLTIFVLVFWLVFVAVCAYIMGSKGQEVWKGVLYGIFLGPFGMIISALFYKTTDIELQKEMYNRKMIDVNEYTQLISSTDKKDE